MSTPPLGDPRSGRDRRGPERRVPSRKHAFERNTLDPISTVKRPLFTVGNGILLVCIIAYGMYATGHLPQLDAFFDNADKYGKAHNSTVVNGLLTYGTYLFFGVIAFLVALIVFGIVQANRKGHADRRVDEIEDRRRAERRAAREDLPSLVMPIGKERPDRRTTDKPAPIAAKAETPAAKAETPAAVVVPTLAAEPVVATTVTPAVAEAPAKPFFETKDNTAAKAAAIAAAAAAEETALNGPQDPSSFVPMPGKERLRPMKTEEAAAAAKPPTVAVEAPQPTVAVVAESAKPAPVVAAKAPATDTSMLNAAATNAVAEAAIAQAKAAALQAEATIAMAKAEAAIAQAKAEAAIAEATAAAAKAAALTR